jgi:hypothetical protein
MPKNHLSLRQQMALAKWLEKDTLFDHEEGRYWFGRFDGDQAGAALAAQELGFDVTAANLLYVRTECQPTLRYGRPKPESDVETLMKLYAELERRIAVLEQMR